MPLSAFPPAITPPAWVDSGVAGKRGLDLLGLRAPVQSIGNSLLNGVTTISPRVRYVSLRAWINLCFIRSSEPKEPAAFKRFARAAENAIVLGNLLVDAAAGSPAPPGLIGPTKAATMLETGVDPLPLDETFVEQQAVNIYGGPSRDLLFAEETDADPVPVLSEERGKPLALLIDSDLVSTRLGRTFSAGKAATTATRAELVEFGARVRLHEFLDDERALLRDVVLPTKPLLLPNRGINERTRLASYVALLDLVREYGNVGIDDVIAWALAPEESQPALGLVRDGWAAFATRDMLAVAHEATLEGVAEILGDEPGDAAAIVAEVLDEGADDRLTAMSLLLPGEDRGTLTFGALRHRVAARCLGIERRGIRRWSGDLNELALLDDAFRRDSPSLLPLAWLIAEARLQPEAEAAEGCAPLVGHAAEARFGVDRVVRRFVRDPRRQTMSIADVARDLTFATVDQHLSTTLGRLALEVTDTGGLLHDVAIVAADAGRWRVVGDGAKRNVFFAGRTAARIDEAVGWLRQLGLVDDAGLTPDGNAALERSLLVLAEAST